MRRRTFLVGLLAVLSLGFLGVGLGLTRIREHAIALRLRRWFGYLRVSHADALRFVRDYEANLGPLRKRLVVPGVPFEPWVEQRFLLSLDLLPSGELDRQVRYVGLFGFTPCWSPTSDGALRDEEIDRGDEGRATFLARNPSYRS